MHGHVLNSTERGVKRFSAKSASEHLLAEVGKLGH